MQCNICGSHLEEKVKTCPYCEADISSQFIVKKDTAREPKEVLSDEASANETQNLVFSSDDKAAASTPKQLTDPEKDNRQEAQQEKEADNKAEIIDALGIEMVFVEGGSFMMGGVDSPYLQPVHEVTVKSFYMSKYLVTQKLWRKVGSNKKNPSYFKGDDLPVERVSWGMAKNFIKKLNKTTGRVYRLPTEAEWEYAARGGNSSLGYSYAGSNSIDEVAWYDRNSSEKTHPVGLKKPNELGLHDMSGNLFEWCEDDWHDNYIGAPNNGQLWREKNRNGFIVIRGGSWFGNNSSFFCNTTTRARSDRATNSSNFGFRFVETIEFYQK